MRHIQASAESLNDIKAPEYLLTAMQHATRQAKGSKL